MPRLTSAQAAARLGIKPQTLYAYVARGLLAREKDGGNGRGSSFDALEIERFAAERRRRPVSEPADGRQVGEPLMVIETTIALIEDDELYFCGQRAADLALGHSYDDVARWLWSEHVDDPAEQRTDPERRTGPAQRTDPEHRTGPEHPSAMRHPSAMQHPADTGPRPDPDAVDLARRVVTQLPPTASLRDQLQVATTTLGAMDAFRFDLSPTTVIRIADRYLAGVLAALPDRGTAPATAPVDITPLDTAPPDTTTPDTTPTNTAPPDVRHSTAARLWPKLTELAPTEGGLRCLNAALVLLIDHDLAVSTLAARAAASARANPYAVVSCGLSALDSALHGHASVAARLLLVAVLAGEDPEHAIADSVLQGTPGLPGFGHRLYRDWDPRARVLFGLLEEVDTGQAALDAAHRVIAVVRHRTGRAPNVDLALATLTIAAEMRPDAGEAIFAVARSGGWLAHALDEYRQPALRLRPVGHYSGP